MSTEHPVSPGDPSASDGDGGERRPHTAGAFDIRTVIGGLLAVYGLILLLTGLLADSTPAVPDPDDYPANTIAGVVLLLVGAGFVLWARLRPVVVPEGAAGAEDG